MPLLKLWQNSKIICWDIGLLLKHIREA